jgi:Protein of unknown function (DUF3455)
MFIATVGSFTNTLLIILVLIIIGIVVALLRRPTPPPTVPDNLKVPDGQLVLLKALGKGVQIYTCKAKSDDPSKFDWTFKAPEADLFNHKGEKIGKHYGGPTWEANDGSKVVGEVKARANAPDASAIPWLLLSAQSHEGSGKFSTVTYLQRVNTVGGKAPTQGCDSSHVGTEARVDYTADYYFYVMAG